MLQIIPGNSWGIPFRLNILVWVFQKEVLSLPKLRLDLSNRFRSSLPQVFERS